MNTLKNWCLQALCVLAVLMSGGSVFATDAETTITTEIASLITAGTAVGVAALGLFAARLIFPVVKGFFRAGK